MAAARSVSGLGHVPLFPRFQKGVVRRQDSPHGQEARVPAGFESLQDPGLQEGAQRCLTRLFGPVLSVMAWTVSRHLQRAHPCGDFCHQAGVRLVQIETGRGEVRGREGDGRPVREYGAWIASLYEAAVAPHADHVRQREQHIRVEVLGVAFVSPRPDEQLLQGRDPVADEGAVVSSERHHHVEQIPQPVVDGRRREEQQILLFATEKAGHRGVPRRVRVSERVRFVEDDETIGVLVVGERSPSRSRSRPYQLFVVRELLVTDDLGGEPCLMESLFPVLLELRGDHEQRMLPTSNGVFLDESEADLRLAGPDAIGEDDSVMLLDDAQRTAEAVLLKRREAERLRTGSRLLLQLVGEQLQKGAKVDGPRVEQAHVREQQLPKGLLVVGRLRPKRVEPLDRASGNDRVVVYQTEFQVLPHPRGSQVG